MKGEHMASTHRHPFSYQLISLSFKTNSHGGKKINK